MVIESNALQVVLLDTVKAYASELYEASRDTSSVKPEIAESA